MIDFKGFGETVLMDLENKNFKTIVGETKSFTNPKIL